MKFIVFLALASIATFGDHGAKGVLLKQNFIYNMAQITGDEADPAENEAIKAKKEATAELKADAKKT